MAGQLIKTYNFALREENSYRGDDSETIKDKRNNIVSENTKRFGFESYVNYLKTIQSLSGRWCNSGYFDHGMVPLAMGPSHLQSHLMILTMQHCSSNGITYYELPAISLLPGGFANGMKDIWVFREELCESCNYGGNPLTFSVIDYIDKEVRKSWNKIIPQDI